MNQRQRHKADKQYNTELLRMETWPHSQQLYALMVRFSAYAWPFYAGHGFVCTVPIRPAHMAVLAQCLQHRVDQDRRTFIFWPLLPETSPQPVDLHILAAGLRCKWQQAFGRVGLVWPTKGL